MALLNFKRKADVTPVNGDVEQFLTDYSIEVMPRTAEKVEDFRALLPEGTRVDHRPHTILGGFHPQQHAPDVGMIDKGDVS